VKARFAIATALVVAAAVPSCKPDFDERASLVDRATVLAVTVEPPEARPGETVTVTVHVATPAGAVDGASTGFAFCTTPKLLTENGSVSAACQSSAVAPIGDAFGAVSAALPADACFVFGPEVRAAEQRPRDPDPTGGFYQPIRARVLAGNAGAVDPSPETLVAFGFARLGCRLANAPADLAARFAAEYRANRNPVLLPLVATMDGLDLALESPGDPASIAGGSRLTFHASWRPEDAETYVAFDPITQAVVARRESMRVSWYATGGSFDADRTGRREDEPESFADDGWTAPSAPGPVHLWAVLRDARGGETIRRATLTVR